MNPWHSLPRPIIGLAPMDAITDHPFRHITKKYGNPDIVYTEFTSVEALCHGDWHSLRNFIYDESQRPIIAQIYGRTPQYFRQVAIMLCELGFDGIDINMGCPAKTVANGGCGAGLIRTPDNAQAIVQAAKAGVEDWCNGATTAQCTRLLARFAKHVAARHAELPAKYQQRMPIPVSVKTRIGYDRPAVEQWIPRLLEVEPVAICLHGRTLHQAYKGQADWDAIGTAAQLCRQTSTMILGNGDATSRLDAQRRAATYDLDGVLIGRASYGNPFVFQLIETEEEETQSTKPPSRPQMIRIALEHVRLFEETYQRLEHYHFPAMRKHLSWYIKEIPGATHIRASLMQTKSAQEVEAVFQQQEQRSLAFRRLIHE
ncbi:MAG: tRNA-dihydrouridine synthase [Caldilineaceae bacterium]